MAADEPPYLTVGTDVSAKYKGAFCEAKIKKVSRMVKCKVTFKNNLGSLMLTDDQIRGPLRIGAEVEARHPEKNQFFEATINKMQDYSQYTVVFDDGDETTLRRTSLCLKSGRHFAESPTLDQFPLTNPEHFGTPVIGTVKTKRKRRATMNSAAIEYYSSDEELLPKKTKLSRSREKDPDVGKVVCVDYGDKRKKDSWYPGLIVMPDGTQETIKFNMKEEYVIRSFKDGKYYQVPKKDTREFTREASRKVEGNTLRTAVDKALLYQEKGELPPHWDKALYQGFELASADEDSQDTDSDSSDDEPSEEKDRFVAQLYKFMEERGTPINKAPTVGNRDLNLYKLFKVVHKMGAYNRVTNQNKWKIVYMKMGLPASNLSGTNQIKIAYKRYLHSFEDFYRKLGCTMVTNTRSTRGRHRSDRNIIITRNRDRDTASPKNKTKERDAKDRSVEKKSEDKLSEGEKKDSSKVKSEKTEAVPKSDDKMKKKVEKPKAEEKDQKPRMKPKEEQKPRLVRSQSLTGKDKKDEEKKELRAARSRTREEPKKEKTDSPEKKETRSSSKVEQEADRKDKDSPGKRSLSITKDNKDRLIKDKKVEKSSKELSMDERPCRRVETPPKDKKLEKIQKDKNSKDEKPKLPSEDNRSSKDKKDFIKKPDDSSVERRSKQVDIDTEKSNGKILRDKKDKPKVDLNVKRVKEEKAIKVESEVKAIEIKSEKEEVDVECSDEAKIIKKEPIKEKRSDQPDSVASVVQSDSGSAEDVSQGPIKSEDDDLDSLPSQAEKKIQSTEGVDENSAANPVDSDDGDGSSSEKGDFKEKVEVGDRVRVKYGRGRTQKVYEAKVLKIEISGGEKKYYVHYAGWNMRYDEWVKRNFIVENISDRYRSGKQPKQPVLNKVVGASPMMQKKIEKVRSPGMTTMAKLSRKNSTSSTNSVSSSRTTRSDKNSLQSSPFSRGLLPKRRRRRKSGLSSSFTDMSQDSESDEDALSLLDPDEEDDDDDADLETDCTQSSRGPKDESFSDYEDKDSLDSFDRPKSCEDESTTQEEPISCTVKEEIRADDLSDDTLNSVIESLGTASSAEDGKDLVKMPVTQQEPSAKQVEPKKNVDPAAETTADEVVAASSTSDSALCESEKEDVKEESSNKVIAPVIVSEPDVKIEPVLKETICQTAKAEEKDINVAGKSPHACDADTKTSTSFVPLALAAPPVPERVVTEPERDKSNTQTMRIKSVSELIEMRYVEKKPEKVDAPCESKNVLEEKDPPIMTYMGSCDSHDADVDVKDSAPSKLSGPAASTEVLVSKQDEKPKDHSCFSMFASYMGPAGKINKSEPTKESFKSKAFSEDSNSASNLLMNFHGIAAQQAMTSIDEPAKMFSFLDEDTPQVKSPFRSEPVPFSSRMTPEKHEPSVPKTYDPKCFKKYLKGEITKPSLSPVSKLLERDPFSIDLISDSENSNEGIGDFPSRSRTLSTSRASVESVSSCQKSLTYSECKTKSIQSDSYGFKVDKQDTPPTIFSQVKKSFPDISVQEKGPEKPSLTFKSVPEQCSESKPTENLVVADASSSAATRTQAKSSTKDTSLPASVITFAGMPSNDTHLSDNHPVEKVSSLPSIDDKGKDQVPEALHASSSSDGTTSDRTPAAITKLEELPTKEEECVDNNEEKICEEKETVFDDHIHESLTELSIDEKDDQKADATVENVKDSDDSSVASKSNAFSSIESDIVKRETKELLSNAETVTASESGAEQGSEEAAEMDSIKKEDASYLPSGEPSFDDKRLTHSTSNPLRTESESCFGIPVSKKEGKKKKNKLSKLEKRSGSDGFREEGKLKEGKCKSKKKKLDSDEFGKIKDPEQKSKSKKMKKNKNKKHLSKYDDHGNESFGKGDMSDDGVREVSEKVKRKEKRKRDEKKFSKSDTKSEASSEHRGECSKKEKKKAKKNKLSGDKKTELSEKKIKKKKKSHADDIDSDSEKESLSVRLGEKKKKKEKKKLKVKDCSSSDDAAVETPKASRDEDPDISFLLCEEKVPASPVNNLPEDTTGSSSMEESSRSNRSPISVEERMPPVNLDMYARAANIDVLNVMNKHNPEACAVLDNTPPTTPSSTESIPSSSPSHDREPFLHYTESTQSGRDSGEGESDGFNCETSRTITESEEYRAATTLAFAVCKSVSSKMTEASRTPVKRQKSENDEYTPSKKKKRSKRSFAGDPGRSSSQRGFSPRYTRGESCDAFDSSGASPITVRSPMHGSTSSSSLYASFSHSASQQMGMVSDGSAAGPTKSGKLGFCIPLHEYKDPEKRISVLQEKMSELRKLYASLKAEVASIDRRRKKARKKYREAVATTANSSSTYSEDGQNCS